MQAAPLPVSYLIIIETTAKRHVYVAMMYKTINGLELKFLRTTANPLQLVPLDLSTVKIYFHPIAEQTYTTINFLSNNQSAQCNHLPRKVIESRSLQNLSNK